MSTKIYDLSDLTIINLQPPESGGVRSGGSEDDNEPEDSNDGYDEDNDDSDDSNDPIEDGQGGRPDRKGKKGKAKSSGNSDGDDGDEGEDRAPDDFSDGAAEEGDGDDSADEIDDDIINKITKEIQDVLADRQERTGKEAPSKPINTDKAEQPKQNKLALQKSNRKYSPRMDWSQLVKMFTAVPFTVEPTRTKINGKSTTAAQVGSEFGASAVPAAERKVLDGIKLAVVFDTSGSMTDSIPGMLGEIQSLLLSQSPNIVGQIGILYYADTSKRYALEVATKKAWPIGSLLDITTGKQVNPATAVSMDVLLRSYATGGTKFTSEMAAELIALGNKGYNVMIGTDTDITFGENWDNFLAVFRALNNKLFVVCATPYDFQAICTKLQVAPYQFIILGQKI